MTKNKVIVIGGGGHAKVVISIIKKMDCYNILGYTDIQNHGKLLDIPYLGKDAYLLDEKKDVLLAFGIGQLRDSEKRKKIVINFEKKGYEFIKIISPDAVLNEEVSVGKGTVIMDGVIINTGTKIGEYCIINTKSSVDHDCSIDNFVHIAPGATICGGVKIGSYSLIGAGTTVVQYRTITKNSFIKAHTLYKI